ncbi:MAG TPA: serine protease [Gemmatales bacterium]|nr:serine protease [Gemmatales bacterium]
MLLRTLLLALLSFVVAPRLQAQAQPDDKKIMGSSFLISAEGHLVTCAHVVAKASSIKVMLDGKEVEAKVLENNVSKDIALLKIDASTPGFLPFFTGEIEQGIEARAFGYPLSTFLGSQIKVTRGTVAGFFRLRGNEVIQIDGLVNPGNSGGPLTDSAGAVIGLVFAKLNPELGQSGLCLHASELLKVLQRNKVPFNEVKKAASALEGPALVKKVKSAVLPVLATKPPPELQANKTPPNRQARVERQNSKVHMNADGNLDGAANTGTYPGGSHPFMHEAFREVQVGRGILVGFSVSTRSLGRGQDCVCGLQPIYRVDGKEEYGKTYGLMLVRSGLLVAKEGYAVGAIKSKTGLNVESLQLVFQKIEGNGLVDKDAYDSEIVGTKSRTPNNTISTNGSLPVGIHGFLKNDNSVHGLGFVMKPEK